MQRRGLVAWSRIKLGGLFPVRSIVEVQSAQMLACTSICV